jgi:hypothetical protein
MSFNTVLLTNPSINYPFSILIIFVKFISYNNNNENISFVLQSYFNLYFFIVVIDVYKFIISFHLTFLLFYVILYIPNTES